MVSRTRAPPGCYRYGARCSKPPACKRAYIFCIRNPAQVARSIAVRDRMAREQAEYRWVLYNGTAVSELGATPVCLVPYEQWFSEPEETARRIAAFVGVPAPCGRIGRRHR